MNATRIEQLTIFHLNDAEFEDAKTKNACLIQAKTPYIAYVRNSEVEDRELFAALEEEGEETPPGRREERLVVYISGNAAEIREDYIGALELVSCSIDAVLFPKKQIQKAGAFNAKLSAKTDFEFLCRIVRETGQCVVRRAKHAANVFRGKKYLATDDSLMPGDNLVSHDSLALDASVAEALAYIIRHHLDHLHALGMMERILSLFCEYAQAENIFPVFQQKLNLFLSDQREYERLARQTAPFVVLRGDDTCGGVLQGFADDLADALGCNGQAVIMVDENFTQHEKLQNMVCKGVVGFQSRALEIDFFRKIRGPKFQFWFDNPLHFENVLRDLPEEDFILCQDANYAALIREYYHTQNAIQFPPGGRTPYRISGWESGGQDDVQEICVRERPYDIIFMGNYFEDAAETLAGFEREFYDYMLLHPCETFEQGLSNLLRRRGAGRQETEKQEIEQQNTEQHNTKQQGTEQHNTEQRNTEQQNTEQHNTEQQGTEQQHTEQRNTEQHNTEQQGTMQPTDELDAEDFVRLSCSLKPACRMVIGHYRNAVVSTILEAGFTLHVYGDGWKSYRGPGREHLEIHPYATVEESLQELAKAKIGLNIMSWHKAGMTERIANIMLSGAVCLSEETEYLRGHMKEGEELVSFSLKRLNELPTKIKDILENPKTRQRIADNAYHKAMAEYTWECRARELISLSERAAKNALTIFVATHVKCSPPQSSIYVPLHVGRYGKPDLGYLGDDTGENISDMNFLYGELTGLFWIWQNIHDIDYVGLCHYRRYFINSQRQAMEKREYLELLEQYDAIVPRHAECEESYYQHFGMSHNSKDLDAVERALKCLYPSYAAAYDRAMNGTVYYWGNLVVTHLSILKAYAEWLFRIFVEASDAIDVSGYDDYHKRVYGFLSEQMFYVFALANDLNCCEVAVGVSEEKAETKVLKEKLKQLIGESRMEEARRLFDEQMIARPDLLLPGSDVNGELQAIYRQLSK